MTFNLFIKNLKGFNAGMYFYDADNIARTQSENKARASLHIENKRIEQDQYSYSF